MVIGKKKLRIRDTSDIKISLSISFLRVQMNSFLFLRLQIFQFPDALRVSSVYCAQVALIVPRLSSCRKDRTNFFFFFLDGSRYSRSFAEWAVWSRMMFTGLSSYNIFPRSSMNIIGRSQIFRTSSTMTRSVLSSSSFGILERAYSVTMIKLLFLPRNNKLARYLENPNSRIYFH